MARDGRTQPWVWVVVGCGAAVVIALLVIGGLGFAGWRFAKGMERQLEDPAAREAKVLEVLGVERLPEGYYPVMALEVPFAMKMAMISDRPPELDDDGEPELGPEHLGDSGLLYFEMPSWGDEREGLEDFVEGRTDGTEFLRRSSIDLAQGEVIQRGEVAISGAERGRYVVQRGSLEGEGDGLTSTVLIDCAGDDRIRVALWFGRDPRPDVQAMEIDLTGTVGDPARLGGFLSAFRFCG